MVTVNYHLSIVIVRVVEIHMCQLQAELSQALSILGGQQLFRYTVQLYCSNGDNRYNCSSKMEYD